jgi:hypothetical protein
VALALTILLLGRTGLSAKAAPSQEYQVKAVFLFNFAQFVDWTAKAFPETGTPLVIGILGDDPFQAYLDDVVRGEKVQNRPIIVERFRGLDDLKTCHVLFVSASQMENLDRILGSVKSKNILTVGESDFFSRRGGMVSFVMRSGKIRFQVNLEAVKAADLSVSSKLLRLADIVAPGKG